MARKRKYSKIEEGIYMTRLARYFIKLFWKLELYIYIKSLIKYYVATVMNKIKNKFEK